MVYMADIKSISELKVVILAGGAQSTLNDEREGIPKPMVDLGGKPLLWHIMKQFSQHGFNEFIVCGGYHVDMIKEYFQDFYIYESDITVDLATNTIEVHKNKTEDWKVTVVDTGLFSATGQRVGMIERFIENDIFLVTYGDCLSDIDFEELVKVHCRENKEATMAMVKPTGRSQLLPINEDGILRYNQQNVSENDTAWINADCYVFSKKVFRYLQGNYDLKQQPLIALSNKDELAVYRHYGYWSAIETKRDFVEAENLWNAGIAPWMRDGSVQL